MSGFDVSAARRTRRGNRRARGRLATVLTLVMLVNLGVPAGAVPTSGDFPLSWLWSWIPQSGAWAAGFAGVQPVDRAPGRPDDHHVATSETDANGVSRGPKEKKPEVKPYKVKGREGVFDEKTSKREPSGDDAKSEMYRNVDGSYSRKVFTDPINFKDATGAWQRIDRVLVKGADGRFRQKASDLDVTLAPKADDPRLVTLAADRKHTLSYGLVGAAGSAGVNAKNSVTYPDVLPGVDFKVEVTASGAKDTLILDSADAPASFLFNLEAKGLTAALEANGSVVLRDEKGDQRITIPAGFMQDAKFDRETGDFTRSDDVAYELVEVDGKQALKVTPDAAWLRDPARVYPVIIDPSSFATNGDSHAYKTDSSDHSAESSMPVGTYDGGTHVGRAYMHFANFATTFNGATLSSVSLAAFLSWTYNCTATTFDVRMVQSAWSVTTVQWPGPTTGPSIGYATPAPGLACTNEAGNRSVGVWVNVDLQEPAIQSWLTGTTNYGLALTARSETTSNQWKRFTSRNHDNYSKAPYLLLTYTGPGTPQIDGAYPPSGYVTPTLTPVLIAEGHDPDKSGSVTYNFEVLNDAGVSIASSGFKAATSWTVPAGKLTRGNNYSWQVVANDGTSMSPPRTYALSTLPPQPMVASSRSQNGGRGYEPSAGNYTTAATDAQVQTYGPPLAITRNYNSQDNRTALAFGTGWSSALDAKLVEGEVANGVAQTVAITYPSGQEVVFGKKADGSFAGPLGRSTTLKCLNATADVIACPTASGTTISGYQLVEKGGHAYTFAAATTPGTYGLTELVDPDKRKLVYTYTAGQLVRITAASGRSLHLQWTGGRISKVTTDRAVAADANSVSEWTYGYTGGLLTSVCAPTTAPAPECTTYQYTSGTTSGTYYPSVVDNLAPTSNWRLAEPTSATDATAASSVLSQGGVDNGIHVNTTRGQPGPLAGSAATATGFNGTSSTVTLPISLANESGYRSASVWFKTTERGKVVLSQSQEALTAGTTNWGYTPLLYVNSSGKLNGQFPTAPVTGALGTLVGPGSGLCMGPAGGSIANGALIQLQPCGTSLTLLWTLDSSSRLAITKDGTTKCAEVVGASTANHADLQLAACGTGTNQKWTMMPNGQIIGVPSGRCIDVTTAGTAVGTQVQIYNCHSPVVGHQTWFGSAHSPIVSSAAAPVVDDGQWHHAVLSASGNSQTLYVDGVAAGTKSGLVVGGQQKNQNIGAGFLGIGWPGQSTGTANINTGTASFFNGSIAEVAYFDKPLSQQDVDALRAAQANAATLLKKIVTPRTKTAAEIAYDSARGVVSEVTDENGGKWGISAPSVEGSSLVYSSAVLGAGPTDYWRFAETDATDAVNEVNGGLASYGTGVTLAQAPGPFGESTRAATFDGVSAHVSLPASDIPIAGPYSISMWFRAPSTTTGGTLFGYQNQPLGTAPTLWNPALYVGTDGRLRGKIWSGTGMSPIATPGRVDDGLWHHVALAANTNSQAMYLDGQLVGTGSGTIAPNGVEYAYIGAGAAKTWAGGRNDNTNYFTGDIAEVAIYKGQQLNMAQVQTQYSARIKAQGRGLIKKYTISDPSDTNPNDQELTTVSYGLPSGMKVAETNALGYETTYGADGSGRLQTVVDANGNYTEVARDARGNTTEQITCQDRSADPQVCSTVYYTYFLNAADELDKCNDKVTETRDARSSGRADNTYLTKFHYDSRCNLIVSVDPIGRRTVTVYTDYRDTAAVDGGFVPADLPISVTPPSGVTQRITYYASGDVASVTDPAGMVTSYEYDGLGRVVKKTDVIQGMSPQIVEMTYDKQSRLLTQTQPAITNSITSATHRAQTVIEYDADGNTIKQSVFDLTGDDVERETISEYDDFNRKSKVIDAELNETTFGYDAFGNLVTQTRPDGVVTESAYDAAGQLLTTKVKNWVDDPNNPSPATDLITTSKGYDPAGRVAWTEDAEHWRTRYEYYDNGQVKKVTRTDDAEPPTVEYVLEENTYDLAGNLVEQVTNNGVTTTTFRVDAAGRTDQSILDPGGLNRVSQTSYDADDRPVAGTARNAQNQILGYSETAYDPLNRVLAKTTYNGPAGTDPGRVATGRWPLDSALSAPSGDYSGNNPGTVSGGVTWSTDHGPVHTAGSAVFDGTGVITGRTSSIDTGNSFTVATWVKLDPTAAAPMVIASQDGNKVSGFTLYYNKASGLWNFSMPRRDDARTGVESAVSSAAAATGVWTHLAGVYDAANKTIKIYVNGVMAGEAARTGVPWTAGGKFVIGGGKSGGEMNNRADMIGRDASGNLLLYRNTGAATATMFGSAVTLATGFGSMNFIGAGDFDGDGKPDIVARDGAGEVWLYPNTTSGGTVSLGTRYSLGTAWSAMTWLGTGDIDVDGRDDLVARSADGDLWSYRSSGVPGQVKLAETGRLIGTGFDIMSWLDVGDVNLDGREDLVGRKSSDGKLYEYPRKLDESPHEFLNGPLTGSGWTSYNISIGDVTGDGRPDLVARATTDNLMWVYANSGLPAPNAWLARTQIGASSWAHLNFFTTADMDGDPSGKWKGSIDDVQVFQRALSDSDISLLRTAGSAVFSPAGSNVSRVSYAVTNGGQVTSMTDPLGNVTDYTYDAAGRVVRTTSPEVTSEVYGSAAVQARAFTDVGYDTFGAVQETRDAHGRVTKSIYDALGRTVETILPAYTPPGASTPVTGTATRTYNSIGQVVTETDRLGETTTFHYDQLGRVSKVTDKAGNHSTFTYDRVGNPTSATDALGGRTETEYGFLGRTCGSTQHVRQPTPVTYTVQYRYGDTKRTCHQAPLTDDPGWATQTRTPGNVVTSSVHNKAGEVVQSFDGAGKDTDYTYDGLGRQSRVTLYDGSYTEPVFTLAGQVTKVREFSSTSVELPTGSTRYDRAGRVVGAMDNLQHETTFTYDASGMLVSQTQPLSATDSITSSFGYDLTGRPTRFTDGRGNATWTTYNSWGLPESTIEPATTAHPNAADRTFTTVYDTAGRADRMLSPGGVSVEFDYDEMGNLLEQSGTAPDATTADRVFTYDALGRMKSFSGAAGTTNLTYDDRGLPLTIRGGSGDNDFVWNADGQLTSRVDGAGTTTFGYDSAGRLDTAANAAAGLSLDYDYNDLSAVSRITYGGGNYRAFSYDSRHRIDVDELKTSAGVSIGKIDYGFDDNGNETSKSTVGFGAATANSYTYDWANRLTSWTTGSTTTQYGYDKSGNRVQSGAATFTYDQRNRLMTSGSTTYAYTPRGTMQSSTVGSVVTTTVADAFNQVVSQGSGVGQQTYAYDALGRVSRAGHQYSGLSNDLAVDDLSPVGGGDDKAYYVRGPGGAAIGVRTSAAQRYLWTDLHTDVVAQFGATDTTLGNKAVYDPLGKPIGTPNLIGRLGYQSEWTDTATGKVNMAARWYNPDTGQFDTRDTVSLSPVGNSGNANRYAYGDSNPLVATDPTGHWPTYDDVNMESEGNKKAKADYIKKETAKKVAYQKYFRYELKPCNKIGNRSKLYAEMGCDAQARPVCPPSNSYAAVLEWCTSVTITADQCFINGQAISKNDLKEIGADCMDVAREMDRTGGKYVGYETGEKTDAITAGELGNAVVKGAEIGAERERKRKEAECEASFTCRNAGLLGAVVGVVAGVGCGILLGWTGVGAVACGFVGGFAGAFATGLFEGKSLDDPSLWIGAAISGGIGALTGGLMSGAGAAVGAGVSKALTGAGARAAFGSAGGAFRSTMTNIAKDTIKGKFSGGIVGRMQQAASLRSSAGSSLRGATCGAGSELGIGVGIEAATNRIHSFAPETQVLMADGSAKPIGEVVLGDEVKATDPVTGEVSAKPVTRLHENMDHDLADVTVRDVESGDATVLHTTQHHPFWNADVERWDYAKDLKPGSHLRDDAGRESQLVVAVRTWSGLQRMRDLTVAEMHTYYVVAGARPILVHNCGTRKAPFKNEMDAIKDIELEQAEQLGVRPVSPGQAGFDETIGSGTVKWAIGEDGTIRVMPKHVNGQEIYHSVLFGGAPVRAAGEADIAGGAGTYFGLRISNHSGHYLPCNCSLDYAVGAFGEAGIPFAPGSVKYEA